MEKEGEFKGGVLEKLVTDHKKEQERGEFLRLLYVAMTRAKSKLFLSWEREPAEDSWGFQLKGFMETHSLSQLVDWKVIDCIEAENYKGGKQSVQVRPPWSDLKKDFDIASVKAHPGKRTNLFAKEQKTGLGDYQKKRAETY